MLRSDRVQGRLWIVLAVTAYLKESCDFDFLAEMSDGDARRALTVLEAAAAHVGPGGDVLWQQFFGGSRHDYGFSVEETAGGSFLLAGLADSPGPASATPSTGPAYRNTA